MTIPPSECEALDALYIHTDGVNRTHQDGWFQESDVNMWRGVTVEQGHVVSLQLASNHLQGTLAAQLHDLPLLRNLNLANNLIVDIEDTI